MGEHGKLQLWAQRVVVSDPNPLLTAGLWVLRVICTSKQVKQLFQAGTGPFCPHWGPLTGRSQCCEGDLSLMWQWMSHWDVERDGGSRQSVASFLCLFQKEEEDPEGTAEAA